MNQTMQRTERGYGRASPRETQDGSGQRKAGLGQRLAPGLGWASLALGMGAVAPGTLVRLIGIEDDDSNRMVARLVGLREIASGVGILTQSRPTGWVWGRVAGDAMDVAVLGAALRSDEARRRNRVVAALAAVLGIAAADLLCSVDLTRRGGAANEIQVAKAITVRQSPEEVYRFWRDFGNLPRFMNHLESVRVLGERRSRWRAVGPGGKTFEWDAEIVQDRPNELIAWRSLDGADVNNAGQVRFRPAPGGRGTEITVELRYEPPAGRLGKMMAWFSGTEPDQALYGDLRRLKQVLETGEVVRSDASLESTGMPQRAARPTEEARPYTAAAR